MSKKTLKNAKKIATKQEIVMEQILRVTRTYSLNKINMNVTLRNDIPDEMETWIELMDKCKDDLQKEIDKIKFAK